MLAKAGRGPTLFGVPPGVNDKWFGFRYQDFEHPVPFTGGLLIAEGFIRELYVHMGFHPAWKYEQVRELVFERGQLVQDDDRSAQVAELRQRMVEEVKGLGKTVDKPTREQISAWVEQCFSREYKIST